MKKLNLSLISLALASSVYSVPNNFKYGDIVSAEKMNENFDFVLKDIRATEVYCNAGETIKSALESGFNYLTIYGTCTDQIIAASPVDLVEFGLDQEKLPPTFGNLIIKGGETNRSSILGEGSMVGTAFQSSLQLINVTIKEHLSASYGSLIHLKDTTVDATDGEIYITENSNFIVENSNIQIPVILQSGSFARFKSIDISISSNSPFFSLEQGSVLEMNNVKITHQSDEFTVEQTSDINNAESLVLATGNSSASISDSTIQTKNSAAIIIQGSFLQLNNSTVKSDGFINTAIVGSDMIIENSTLINTINEAMTIIEGSSGRISNSNISSTGDQALFISRSNLTINNNSSISLSDATDTGKETMLIASGSFVDLNNSTVTNTTTGSAIYLTESSSLMVEKSTIQSQSDDAIGVNYGSKLFAKSSGDTINIDRINDTNNIDISAYNQSSIFFGNNSYSGNISCSVPSYVDINDTSNVSGCSE